MAEHRPPFVSAEKRLPVTIRAFRQPARPDGSHWWLYDIWIVDQERWTGRLPRQDAYKALLAEGLGDNKISSLLDRARKRANRAMER